jgi:hypothetical protein
VTARESGMRVAEGVRLFILDDGGVLFVAATQELCLFNASATFIWCDMEDGLGAEEIAVGYARVFEAVLADAERHVIDALAQWQGLGYIEGFAIPPGSEQPLLQALARLLVNDPLRIQFEQDPRRVAARLGVGRDELDDFLALDAKALQRQAQLLRARQARGRGKSGTARATVFSAVQDNGASVLAGVARAALRHPAALPIACRCRLLETSVLLRFGSEAQAAKIVPVVAHLAVDAAHPIESVVDFLELDDGHGHVMLVDGVPVGHCRDIEALAPLVKSTVRRMATDRHRFVLEIHAGVVAAGESCLLLPGAPGKGKTTLTAALGCAGFRFFSDEVALLEEDFAVRSVPLSLGIKPGAVEVLASRYPRIRELAAHDREDEQRVRYLNPPGYRRDLPDVLPVRWIVFPAYAPDAETRLVAISRTEALRLLLDECMVLPQLLDEARVQAMVRWLRGVECMRLPLASLDDAVRLLQRHCGIQTAPGLPLAESIA